MGLPQHRYEIGQKLLCFEPDTSKAKVIYFAKILKRVENSKSAVPHYAVHFQGWKCKWDREVPEHLLLDNTEFNRTLKKKIDEIVRYERSRTRRKQRIDMVLKAAALAGDNVDWDNVPGVWVPKNKRGRDDSSIQCPQSPSDRTCSEQAASTVSDDFDSELTNSDSVTQSQFENLHFHQLFSPSLLIHANLHGIVNAHCASLTGNTDPCKRGWCSVLQVLQNYVDNFPYAESQVSVSLTQVNCPDRVFRQLNPAYAQTDQSRLMCADVCSSLRVLFDCMIDRYLLLPQEQTMQPVSSAQFPCNGRAFPPGTELPSTVSPLYRYSSPRYELLPESEADRRPQTPCLNYPAHFLLRLFVNLPEMLNAMNLTACRRTIVTRHVHMLLDFLNRTRHWWFAHLTPRSFALPNSDHNSGSTVESGQKPPASTATTVPISEASSEMEPQAAIPPSRRSSPRHGTRGIPSRLATPVPDHFTDPVTAIKLPISQAITSPAQLEQTIKTEPQPQSYEREDLRSSRRQSHAAKMPHTNNPHTTVMTVRSRLTMPSNTQLQNTSRPGTAVTDHTQSASRSVPVDRQKSGEGRISRSTRKTAILPRVLRPRVSEIRYK